MTEPRSLAVIDLGSNSFRLVVFGYGEDWWKRTDEIHESVRVGEGLDATGELQEEPMERAIETLELYAHFCSATGIDAIRTVATSAIRDASNQAEFLDLSGDRVAADAELVRRLDAAAAGELERRLDQLRLELADFAPVENEKPRASETEIEIE